MLCCSIKEKSKYVIEYKYSYGEIWEHLWQEKPLEQA